jgi:ribosome biogenesis GTPase / thiamine phosphate phosphatase
MAIIHNRRRPQRRKSRSKGPDKPRRTKEIVCDATVVAVYGYEAEILHDDATIHRVALQGKAKKAVVGDRTKLDADIKKKRISALGERSKILRRPMGEGFQILASNVRRLAIVIGVMPPFKSELIDRLLVAAEVEGIEPILLLNKIDLPETAQAREQLREFNDIGYRTFTISALTGENFESIARELNESNVALFGPSGAGKSTILNRLIPGVKLRTGTISTATGKGRHTTSVATAHRYGDSLLIDMPGIREFGISGIDPRELSTFFPEFERLSAGCRFKDCQHYKEPGCAVVAAKDCGEIQPRRHRSYLKLRQELIDQQPY